MAPNLKIEIVGIRPGEKLHEIMCPSDDSHLTVEFDDHFVISPSIKFTSVSHFETNAIEEQGTKVDQGFEYNSGTNPHFLTADEIRDFNKKALC